MCAMLTKEDRIRAYWILRKARREGWYGYHKVTITEREKL